MGKKGFTLLEVLTVISVMVILAGIVLPSLRTARKRAFQAKAQTQIVSLMLALKNYKSDLGDYPAVLNAAHLMLGDASFPPTWRGPYMELKLGQDMNAAGDILDAWGSPFHYVKHSSLTNGRYFDLVSLGPDRNLGTADDIHHWKK